MIEGKDDMGTNYYLKTDCCDKCGRGDGPLHIGKSSMGWCFSLHVDAERGINSLEDWEKLFRDPVARIEDEYGKRVWPDEMLDTIKNRRGTVGEKKEPTMFYKDLQDMLQKNGAVIVKEFGLLRRRLSSHCVGHGDGPWDLCAGEFS